MNSQTRNCVNCKAEFVIEPDDFVFYDKVKVPLPTFFPSCRLQRRVYRNIAQHFHGDSPCPNEFETTYAPDRPEIVYCEQCYQAEVA